MAAEKRYDAQELKDALSPIYKCQNIAALFIIAGGRDDSCFQKSHFTFGEMLSSQFAEFILTGLNFSILPPFYSIEAEARGLHPLEARKRHEVCNFGE